MSLSLDSLLDRLATNAAKNPEKQAVAFLQPGKNGGKVQKSLTYGQLVKETDRIARLLLSNNVKPGDR